MKNKRQRKVWKAMGAAGLALLLLFLVAPYLFPLSVPAATQGAAPFENSVFLLIDGVSFHYRVFQPPEGQSQGKLLLVHGLAGSTFSFEALAPLLAGKGYLVIAADLPGFGYSDRTLDFQHSQQNRGSGLWRLLRFVDEGLPERLAGMPWHLAGHSMGGGTAAAMALQHPNRTATLVLIDAALSGDARGGLLTRLPVFSQWLGVALEHFVINEGAIRSFLASAYGEEPASEQVAGHLAPLQLPGTAASLAHIMRTAKNEEGQRLAALSLPVLAIWGERDTWVPVSELEPLQAALPDMTVQIIPGAGHCPMETHTPLFADVLLQWLQ